MKTLLVYPPFCTPASPPYSITYLYAFLRDNAKSHRVDVLDLNLEFHKQKFPEFQKYFQGIKAKYDPEEYSKTAAEYRKVTSFCYSQSNKLVVEGKLPELFKEMLDKIKSKKPDVVAFSIVYSSQSFYAYSLCAELKKRGIRTVVGGPAANTKLNEVAEHLKNEIELLEYVMQAKPAHDSLNCDTILDFSIFPLSDYFTPEPVLPIKTSGGCYYRQCAFCTHHHNTGYYETKIENIAESIKLSNVKRVFFIDDLIHKKRLLEIARVLKPLNVSWTCQLKPTADLDLPTLKTLHDSGLKMVLWGVESGCDRILTLMRKGTNKQDIAKVLRDSSAAGIKNCLFIIFGFPTETKEEFVETIEFLKQNSEHIDLISTSIFGLQKGTPICECPADFGITKIIENKRTILEPSIEYEVSTGLTQKQATLARQRYRRTLEKLDKYPKAMNFFREHMLCLV
jgi:radical SAM superfamily enzyme YgiQ (UPF0313 family)